MQISEIFVQNKRGIKGEHIIPVFAVKYFIYSTQYWAPVASELTNFRGNFCKSVPIEPISEAYYKIQHSDWLLNQAHYVVR